jgi:hypothetical protein
MLSISRTTLSQTEKGYAPPIEHIGKPICVKNEMGEYGTSIIIIHIQYAERQVN